MSENLPPSVAIAYKLYTEAGNRVDEIAKGFVSTSPSQAKEFAELTVALTEALKQYGEAERELFEAAADAISTVIANQYQQFCTDKPEDCAFDDWLSYINHRSGVELFRTDETLKAVMEAVSQASLWSDHVSRGLSRRTWRAGYTIEIVSQSDQVVRLQPAW